MFIKATVVGNNTTTNFAASSVEEWTMSQHTNDAVKIRFNSGDERAIHATEAVMREALAEALGSRKSLVVIDPDGKLCRIITSGSRL